MAISSQSITIGQFVNPIYAISAVDRREKKKKEMIRLRRMTSKKVMEKNGGCTRHGANGLLTTCLPSDHSTVPKSFVLDGIVVAALNVTTYDFFSFARPKLSTPGTTDILTDSLVDKTETL
ncbi:protein kinase superfamily protein [Striga asiatica]|uniref:Protein kinase superfamily protein n=1 Tax=Striga asiatica TaxID=4170 RepID=A0A5A7PD92_STRAF|nr:protein kinase superfamily protein [Striga asiatica]